MKLTLKKRVMIFVPFLAALHLLAAVHAAYAKPTEEAITLSTTAGGVEFGLWGGTPDKPSPTLIVLTGTIMDSFTRGHFLRAGNILGPRGYLCVAIDLPDHGKQATPGKSGVKQWAQRAIDGDDFVAEFNGRMKQVVDHLVAEGLTDPAGIVVSGTSRGGFMSLHYAAFDPRVAAVVAYAPATDLGVVHKYFDVAKDAPMVDQLSAFHLVPELVGRPVLIFIGDRDDGVDTDSAIRLARHLSAAALEADVPSRVELHVLSEPRGHSLPADLRIPAARWIYKVIEGQELTDL